MRKSTAKIEFMKIHYPYVLITDMANTRSLLLNRNYKPLGQSTNDNVDYEQFMTTHAKPLNGKGLEMVRFKHIKQGHVKDMKSDGIEYKTYFLYFDELSPWRSIHNMKKYQICLDALEQLNLWHGVADTPMAR